MNAWLRNARLADGRVVDVEVDPGTGTISQVRDAGDAGAAADAVGAPDDDRGRRDSERLPDADAVLDLDGWLLLPALAEPHAHLDKALTADIAPNASGDLPGAIEAWIGASERGLFGYDDTVERAAAAIERLLVHGTTAIRTHVNVMESNGTTSLRAVKEAAARFEGLIDVQTVALTSSPVVGPAGAGNRAALHAAIEEGVDMIGGCPHLDPDGPGLIRQAIELATDAGIGIDLHVDETLDPSVLNLRELARQVLDSGFDGGVAASHCVTLGMQTPAVQAEVARLVAESGIAVFPLPQTNLFLQGRDDPTATPRGLTAVAALVEAGVLVGAGADNVQDPFNLVGRSDPLETAALMVMAGHQLPGAAFDMVSNNVRRAIGLDEVRIEPGSRADLLAVDAPSVRGALADAPMSRRVLRGGVLVASADQQTAVHRA